MNLDRFRFRYWFPQENRMMDINQLNIGDMLIADDRALNEEFPLENYPLMQCTGLRDKNGTLIYEGDVLADEDKHIPQYISVEWDEDISYMPYIKACGFNLKGSYSEYQECEIIGHIFMPEWEHLK